MNSLLSPGKPVLTRFKVPGEGAYTLAAELHAPLPRHPPLPAAGASSNKSAASTSGGTTSTTPAASPPGGPLGLTHVTSISFARRASLTVATQDNNSLQSPILSTSSTAPPTPPLTSNQAAPSTTGSSSIFSLRKLTGLGSTFSSKFGSTSSTEITSSLGSGAEETAQSSTTSAPSRWFSSAASVVAGSGPPTTGPSGNPAPRAPPRAALDSSGAPTDTASNSAPSRTSSSRNTSSHVRDSSPSTCSSRSRSRSRGEQNSGGAHGNRPLGVMIYNATDCVCAVDLPECKALKGGAPRNTLEPSLTLSMRSAPTVHLALNHEKLILIVGCANGEVIYYPDISSAATTAPAESSKRLRGGSAGGSSASTASNGGTIHPAYFIYNRDGAVNASRVVALKWVPGSLHRFVAAHVDGMLVVYDTRTKPHSSAFRAGPLPPASTDSEVGSGSTTSGVSSAGPSLSLRVTGSREPADKGAADKPDPNRDQKSTTSASDKTAAGPTHRRTGSQAITQLAQHEISVHRMTRKKNSQWTVWQIGCGLITDIAFAPVRSKGDPVLLAISGRDGYLRIMDFVRECPVAAFRSYFGALLCVSWSPDGKYVATGGEDDLVSIWCPAEERIVARLEGHTSWVSAVAWDRTVVGGRYRLASAGQDTKLLLWDFSVNMLHHRVSHPRSGAPMVRLRSYAREPREPPAPPSLKEERRTGKLARLRAHASAHNSTHTHVSVGDSDNTTPVGPQETPLIVGALGRAEVPIVEPVLTHVAHCEPLTHVVFQDVGVVTADSMGTVKLWSRPPTHDLQPLSLSNKDDPIPDNMRRRGGPRKARNSDLD